MEYKIDNGATETVLHISGQLTYSDREAVDELIPRVVSNGNPLIVVDMKDLEYMDSSGLGMLLTLREQAKANKAKVVVARSGGEVREMLELACFDTLFTFRHDG